MAIPEEWARIALAELKMRHTLCGGQYAERRYVTKLHQPLFRTAVVGTIKCKRFEDDELFDCRICRWHSACLTGGVAIEFYSGQIFGTPINPVFFYFQ